MTNKMQISLHLTQREVEVIRQALRQAEETHKRNDFPALVLEVQDLRSNINDAIINASKVLVQGQPDKTKVDKVSEEEVEMCTCGNAEATAHTYDNQPICDDCAWVCDSCGDIGDVDRDSMRVVDDDYNWCADCIDSAYYCERHEEYSSEGGYYIGDRDEYWCEHCANNWANWCDTCDQYFEDGCDTCNEDTYQGQRVIHDYSYRPDAVFHCVKDNERLFFGFELEMEFDSDRGEAAAYAFNKLEPDNWAYLKNDGSLDNGFELVTHPMSFDFLMEDDNAQEVWDTIYALREEHGAKSYNTRTCGFHIHISRTGFRGGAHMHRFLNLVYSNPKLYQKLAGRSSDQWAKFDDVYRRYYDENAGQYKLMKSFKQKLSQFRESDRYSAVNTLNPHTFEMRIFKGTLSIPALKAHIQLAHASVEYTRDLSVQQVSMGALSQNNFLAYIYANMDIYPELVARIEHKQILPDSVGLARQEDVVDPTMPSVDEVPIIVNSFNEAEERRRAREAERATFDEWCRQQQEYMQRMASSLLNQSNEQGDN